MNQSNQWDKKFKQEYPFMAFGSLLNAYGQMNQQKPKEIKEFLKDADSIFELAIKLMEKAKSNAEEITNEENPDIDTK